MRNGSLTLLGLGTGNPKQITLEALEALENAAQSPVARVYAVPSAADIARCLVPGLEVYSMEKIERLAEAKSPFEHIVQHLLAEAFRDGQDVLYVGPGHPLVLSDLGLLIRRTCKRYGFPVRIISGLSFFSSALEHLYWRGDPGLQLLSAPRVAQGEPLSSCSPVLLYELDELIHLGTSAHEALMTSLRKVYPDTLEVTLVYAIPNLPGHTNSRTLQLSALATAQIPEQSSLWIPRLKQGSL